MKQECDNLKTKILDQSNREIMIGIKHLDDEIIELKIANGNVTEEVKKLKTLHEDTVPWNIRGKYYAFNV